MIPASQDYGEINRRLRELRAEQGLPDDDPLTATGDSLDMIGAVYGLKRSSTESEDTFRARIMIKVTARDLGDEWL